MFECFVCGHRAVIWDSDFSFDECGYEGEGIVSLYHCKNCGAEFECSVSEDENMNAFSIGEEKNNG